MILFTIFPFAPPPPPLAFLCFKLFRSLYIWFSMPPVCHFPLFFIHFIMLYDFRPTGWKMTIILLQQPAINRAEEYMEWRAEWGDCGVRWRHVRACVHACIHTRTHIQVEPHKHSVKPKHINVFWLFHRFLFSGTHAYKYIYTYDAFTDCTIE